MTRARSFLSGLAVVLACAAGGFLLRSAVTDDPPVLTKAALPAVALESRGPIEFSTDAAASRAVPEDGYLLATSERPRIRVFRRPGGKLQRVVRQKVLFGTRVPLTFLVRKRMKGWAKVWLPTRPNGTSGWIRRSNVDYSVTRWHLRVRRGARRLDVFEGRRRVRTFKIGIGRSIAPTPRGRYYITDLIRTKDPKGFYGPYSLGLSAHSPVLTSFNGGNGQIGIHGTNDPSSIGQDVSAGCIRVGNDVITALAKLLPLGTPVDVKP